MTKVASTTGEDDEVEREIQNLSPVFDEFDQGDQGLSAPANIIVCGLTGVGKSTLINAMFGDDFCRTGTGAPVTVGVRPITQPDKPVTLYDTEGLEIEDSVRTAENLRGLISRLRDAAQPRDQPHLMWLCVNTEAARFEDIHERLVKLAKDEKLPVVIILTQDYFGESEELADAIRESVGGNLAIVPVVAHPHTLNNGKTIPSRGLDQVLRMTLARLPASVRDAFEFAQVADLRMRKEKAIKIVDRSMLIAGGSAFPASFIWGAHSAILIALETHMLKSINKVFGITMGKKETKALTLGLSGVAMAAAGGPLIATQVAALIPGVGQISSASAGAIAAAGIVKLLGSTYVQVVGDLKRGELDPTVDQILEMVSSYLGDPAGDPQSFVSRLNFLKTK